MSGFGYEDDSGHETDEAGRSSDVTDESLTTGKKTRKSCGSPREEAFGRNCRRKCIRRRPKYKKAGKRMKYDGVGEKRYNIDGSQRIIRHNSVKEGEACFSKLISPIPVNTFFKDIWEKKPLCISRSNKRFYEHVCTVQDFKNALSDNDVRFTENVDVTTYVNGKKVTEEHVGRATPELVTDLLNKGRSIRLLNPQTFIKKIRRYNSKLQEFFRCFVGANIYLTPGNSQGFAPHYDDVEAFVLQLDGRKEWRIYRPRPGEDLPRFSSGNFTDSDIGEPILKIILEPGDLLYFPRGVIHQARALIEGSIHITVSCYQRNSWADFLEKLLPVALQTAIETDLEYRKGLPIDYLDHLGLVASDSCSSVRKETISHLKALVKKLIHYLPIDSCADQLGKNFVHDALPPVLHKYERCYAGKGSRKRLKKLLDDMGNTNVKVKLIRAYSCRLICEEEKFKLYYNTKNGLNYHEVGYRCMRMPATWAIMTEHLIQNYPAFTDVRELLAVGGLKKFSSVSGFIEKLWKKGLIFVNPPLEG